MANLMVLDGNGDARYLKASGAGSDADPMVLERTDKQATHDNLNCNANMQVGNADVGNANPVPVSDAGGSLTIDQTTHDNLNLNANMQVGNADVATANPVPTVENRGATATHQYTTSADMSGAAANLTAAPASGKSIAVTDLIISAEAAMVLTLKEETSGTVITKLDLAAHSIAVVNLAGRLKLPTADKKLQGQTSASGNIHITVVWVEV